MGRLRPEGGEELQSVCLSGSAWVVSLEVVEHLARDAGQDRCVLEGDGLLAGGGEDVDVLDVVGRRRWLEERHAVELTAPRRPWPVRRRRCYGVRLVRQRAAQHGACPRCGSRRHGSTAKAWRHRKHEIASVLVAPAGCGARRPGSSSEKRMDCLAQVLFFPLPRTRCVSTGWVLVCSVVGRRSAAVVLELDSDGIAQVWATRASNAGVARMSSAPPTPIDSSLFVKGLVAGVAGASGWPSTGRLVGRSVGVGFGSGCLRSAGVQGSCRPRWSSRVVPWLPSRTRLKVLS